MPRSVDLWFPPARIPLEDGSSGLLPVLVTTAAHSRFTPGSWELIAGLGAAAVR